MRFENKKENARRRKASWLVGLICGLAFALLFCLGWFIPPLLADYHLGFWFPLIGSISLTAPLADRIGKRFNVMTEQFAGPVALCCMLSLGLFLFLIFSISN
jgi:peptidoglycan/LPS O-acetylase OafA/YrhL